MKALLRINGFTKIIEVLERSPDIYIAQTEPMGVRFVRDGCTSKNTDIKKWRFIYDRYLDDLDLLVYQYDGEFNEKFECYKCRTKKK